jgi:glycosyltransferase involved in cell wall biosynthesis
MSLRVVFLKQSLGWPRVSGHDVHSYNTMKALSALGHSVSLITATQPDERALEGLPISGLTVLDHAADSSGDLPGTWLQRKFRSFYGVSDRHISATREAVRASRADAVVVVGLHTLPYFAALDDVVRVWYAADEWIWHHLSQLRLDGELVENLREAAIKGVYERAHRSLIDRVWVVSQPDQLAMRWLAGMHHVDVLPHGVDGEYFHPGGRLVDDRSLIFWGRLDFGPNVQALEWFVRRVWPALKQHAADARFTVAGFNPSDAVRRLADTAGVSLAANVPDLRDLAGSHAIAVLPFVSGGGIKNKLLEAAALGLPIVCTTQATSGLRGVSASGIVIENGPAEMARAIIDLWKHPDRRRRLGAMARRWVLEHHTWEENARQAAASISASLPDRIRRRAA